MYSSLKTFTLSLAMALSLSARESGVTLSPSGVKSNYFAGEEASFSFSKEPSLTGRLAWRLASGSRTVARGEREIDVGMNGATRFSLDCQLPPLRDGLIMPVDLAVSLIPHSGGEAVEINRRIWLFPHDVAFKQHSMLKRMKIHLFDPDKSTLTQLEKVEIPFTPIHTIDRIASLTNGTIVVAAGISFQEYSALPGVLIDATQRGLSVLMLAPQEGVMRIPLGEDAEKQRPCRFLLEGSGVIKGLDKRLDDSIFDGKRFVLTENNNITVFPREKEKHSWQWIELDYSPSGGKFVICGFDIPEKWDNSPAPRYLLLKILQYLDKS